MGGMRLFNTVGFGLTKEIHATKQFLASHDFDLWLKSVPQTTSVSSKSYWRTLLQNISGMRLVGLFGCVFFSSQRDVEKKGHRPHDYSVHREKHQHVKNHRFGKISFLEKYPSPSR
jgi:hypothetical protein